MSADALDKRSYRLQHSVPASIVFVVAITVAWISWTREPADVYLFPRLVSVFFVLLAVWNLTRALLGLARVGVGFTKTELVNILPGTAIMLFLIYFAVTFVGFYVSSTIAFLAIATIYDPAPLLSAGAWIKRLLITAGFMGAIYVLFAVLLKVQTQMAGGLLF